MAKAIHLEAPEGKIRTVVDVKKKWNNLMTAAKKDIGLHKKTLTGTGIIIFCVYFMYYLIVFACVHRWWAQP